MGVRPVKQNLRWTQLQSSRDSSIALFCLKRSVPFPQAFRGARRGDQACGNLSSSEAFTPSTETAQVVGRPPFVTSSTVSEMIEVSMRRQTKTCALSGANFIFVWKLVEGFRLAHGNQKIRPLLFTLGLLRRIARWHGRQSIQRLRPL